MASAGLRRKLEDKEEQLSRLILEQAGEGIVVIDSNGIVIRRSESARNMARIPLLSNRFDAGLPLVFEGEPLDTEKILTAMRAGRILRGLETLLPKPDGTIRTLLVSASPLLGSSREQARELLGCVITLTDITDRKRAEEALARQAGELAQANSDLRQFAYSASHDLREPLRQLAIFSELLQHKYRDKLDPEACQLIRYTVDGARRMEVLLSGLLDYSQAPSRVGSAGPSDANEVLRKMLTSFDSQIAETGARIESAALPPVRVNEVHLMQLLQNLIGNALKYRSEAPPVIRISAEQSNGVCRICIADNGIGIPEDYREQVFHLFKRLHGGGKYAGSGIGLAICQRIVQSYGGRIWVESAGERGSKFVFTLPAAEAASEI